MLQLGLRDTDLLQPCAVWIAVGGAFQGSGFLVSPGLAVTSAHVVLGAESPDAEVVVQHSSGAYAVPVGGVRAEPSTCDGGRFHPYPDLAAISVPQLGGHPVVQLATGEAEPGTDVVALGYSESTPSPGVQPQTLVLRVLGRSGAFMRVTGDGVREGYSGSMLLGPDGLVCGVLKGSRSYSQDQGGWFVPVMALAAFLGVSPNSSLLVSSDPPPSESELVDALMAFPAMARAYSRYDLLDKMGSHLGLAHSFEVDDRPDRRDHLYRLARRCWHYRDRHAALRALYTAMEELVPYDSALERLHLIIGRAVGSWEST